MDSLILVSEWGKRTNMAKKKIENQDFELTNLPVEAQDPSISKEDFVLTNVDKSIHDQKFQTKPTTFFKDSLKRFAKNKSSVVAAVILGLLLLMAVFVPIFDTNDTDGSHPEIAYLQPKLFDAGTGFWDGTKKYYHIPVDISEDPEGKDKEANWWPKPGDDKGQFSKTAVTNKKFSELSYTDAATEYGKDGYFKFGYYNYIKDEEEYAALTCYPFETFEIETNHYLTMFDTYDLEKLQILDKGQSLPDNCVLGKAGLYFSYETDVLDENLEHIRESIEILPYKDIYSIGSAVSSQSEDAVNISEILRGKTSLRNFVNAEFEVRVQNELNHENTIVLIRGLKFSTDAVDQVTRTGIVSRGFDDATKFAIRPHDVGGELQTDYWETTGSRGIHLSKSYFCDFTYDVYEAKLGKRSRLLDMPVIQNYIDSGAIRFDYDIIFDWDSLEYIVNPDTFHFEVLKPAECSIDENTPVLYTDVSIDQNPESPIFGEIQFVRATIMQYKEIDIFKGRTTMPKFLFGTNKSGRDMLKYVFEGLRTSLILGIVTSAVCFLFGLVYGAISGYFGGNVDIVMERFTDILSGVPWIVVMTLAIIHLGRTFFVFALALCLTGWIGTAATTRTQFYRFRGREYVLASRTLGASDARLIAKHILPNAMGTIITSAVLMVPSVIFSEATIAYLNLGLQGLSSLGVTLQDNQSELQSNPYLLIFPSVIIALLMISFNLFGNGLRDAVNPSLKGEGE